VALMPSAIDEVIGMIDKGSLVFVESRIRGETLSMASQDEVTKRIAHGLARNLVEKLEPLHREFIDRRDDRGGIYKPGEFAPYAFGPGHDMVVHGELFVLTRSQYDALVVAIGRVKYEIEHSRPVAQGGP
jgi:hypothetical protein